ASFTAAFQLTLSNRPESVAVELNATNATIAAMILKRRCIACMLSPEAEGSKAFLACFCLLRLASICHSRESGNPARFRRYRISRFRGNDGPLLSSLTSALLSSKCDGGATEPAQSWARSQNTG